MTHPDRLDEIGLPAGRDCRVALSYNSPARTLVAICTCAPSSETRVFTRHISENRYREVVLPLDGAFIDDAVVCSGTPLLFLSVWHWCDTTRSAADFAALARLDLPHGVAKPLPQPTIVDTLSWTGPAIPTGVWVEQILGVAPDGRQLSIVAAVDVPTGETMYASRAERWLAKFDVLDGSVKPISRLLADLA